MMTSAWVVQRIRAAADRSKAISKEAAQGSALFPIVASSNDPVFTFKGRNPAL